MIGFETVGNATAICFDDRPVLATDPWITGDAYFGSWGMSHEIPREQYEHVLACEYVWFSHGHPDHANPASFDLLRKKTVLLPDHVGGRMHDDLRSLGFSVQVLKDREWTQLSPRIRVLCVSDYNQDGILLIDVNGRLIVDLNDAVERGWGRFVRKIVAGYPISFLLKLFGYGDADMINVFREDGSRLLPPPPGQSPETRESWDALLAEKVRFWSRYFGTRYVVPFSMFHAYQRTDSAWANAYTTPHDAFPEIASPGCEVLPPFIRYSCESDDWAKLAPPACRPKLRDPRELGDDWSQPLDADEVRRLERYVRGNELLRGRVDAFTFRVGGKEHRIPLAARSAGRSITFDVPRASLMTAVDHEIFDDLLIGNFMKTTVHGDWGRALAPNVLYRHVTPYVARYADNGRVRTEEALAAYFDAYRERASVDYLLHRIEHDGVQRLRSFIDPSSRLFRVATRVYSFVKGDGRATT